MTRLMHTARTSQGTFIKLVIAIADYQLTQDEKSYLYSLTEGNNKITEQLKQDHLNFFHRIFVDSNKDFDIWAKAVTDSTNARLQKSANISSSKPTKSIKPPAPAAHLQSAKTSSPLSTEPAKPHPPLSHLSPSTRLAPLARMTVGHVTADSTATLSEELMMSGALNSAPQIPSQETQSEFLVRLARARAVPYDPFAAPIVPLRARVPYDPFAAPVAPFGDDFQVEDSQSGSTYEPGADEGDDDLFLPPGGEDEHDPLAQADDGM